MSVTNSNTLSHKFDPSPNRTPAVPLDKYLKENYFRMTKTNSNSYESPDYEAIAKRHPHWWKTVGKEWIAKGKKSRKKHKKRKPRRKNSISKRKVKRKVKRKTARKRKPKRSRKKKKTKRKR